MSGQKERCSRPLIISEIFSSRSSLGVEWREMWKEVERACGQCKATYNKVTRAFCDDNFLRIAPYPPYSLDLASVDFSRFLVWASQKSRPRAAIRVCRWTSFENPRNFGWNQRWHFGSGFPRVSRSTYWIEPMHCNKWKVRGMKQTMIHWVIIDNAQIWRCSSHRETSSPSRYSDSGTSKPNRS
jgi:hypothetical protein